MEARKGFVVPGPKKRELAIGSKTGLSDEMKMAFADDGNFFKPIPKPGVDDWLHGSTKPGQNYTKFSTMTHNAPSRVKTTIYIQPLDPQITPELLEVLETFATQFFLGLKVKIQEPLNVETMGIKHRSRSYGNQYSGSQILTKLKSKIPRDAFCRVGCMMEDIYHREAGNYVFGLAGVNTGVFSFARYNPLFWDEPETEETIDIIYYRSCKTLCHEICHLFGIKHCTYFSCLMQGSNHIEEAGTKPFFLCPMCLRKLHSVLKFNPTQRYKNLADVCTTLGGKFVNLTDWYRERAETIRAAKAATRVRK